MQCAACNAHTLHLCVLKEPGVLYIIEPQHGLNEPLQFAVVQVLMAAFTWLCTLGSS